MNARRRTLIGLGAAGALAASFVLGARLTANGSVERISGEVTTKSELRRTINRAHDDGYDEGHHDGYDEGESDGRSAAEDEASAAINAARADAYDQGRLAGATDAYPAGLTDGCEKVFDELAAERVMNFDIFHNGGSYAQYIERAGCS